MTRRAATFNGERTTSNNGLKNVVASIEGIPKGKKIPEQNYVIENKNIHPTPQLMIMVLLALRMYHQESITEKPGMKCLVNK